MRKTARIGRPPGQRPYEFNAEAAIRARLRQKLTLRQLSERCETVGNLPVADSNIAKYERGSVCPSPQTLGALAAALGLETDDLITYRQVRQGAA